HQVQAAPRKIRRDPMPLQSAVASRSRTFRSPILSSPQLQNGVDRSSLYRSHTQSPSEESDHRPFAHAYGYPPRRRPLRPDSAPSPFSLMLPPHACQQSRQPSASSARPILFCPPERDSPKSAYTHAPSTGERRAVLRRPTRPRHFRYPARHSDNSPAAVGVALEESSREFPSYPTRDSRS